MDIGGRATAEEINRGLRIRKEKSFWRVASLTLSWVLDGSWSLAS